MTLFQIAMRNLGRRKGKMAFMLVGLVLSAATVVSIYSIVRAMQVDIQRQLSDLGANIVITPDTGELTFHYGGITIPELVFDADALTEVDVELIRRIPDSQGLLAVAPKLMGIASVEGQKVVVAGTHLPAEFIVKPWLRFLEEGELTKMPFDDQSKIEDEKLNLERLENVPELEEGQTVVGFNVAALLKIEEGDRIRLGDREYTVLSVLVESGSAEDNQMLMNLQEAQLLLGRPGELTVIEVASDFNLVPEEMLLEQLQEALPHASVTGVRQAVMGRDELLSSIARFGIFAGGLIFFTGILVVVLTMSAAVRERTREIGIFRAVGFRSRHLFFIIITEGLMVSAAGGLLGYHAGLLAARLAGPLLAGTKLATPWQFGILLAAVVLTAAAGGLASLYPAARAARLDPAEALRFF